MNISILLKILILIYFCNQKNSIWKKREHAGLTLPDFETCYKAVVLSTITGIRIGM